MEELNPHVKTDESGAYVEVSGKRIPCITRQTREFNQQLISAGSSNTRAMVSLNPVSPRLKKLYREFKNKLSDSDELFTILQKMNHFSREVFPKHDDWLSRYNHLVRNYPYARDRKIIPLSYWVEKKVGVCTHYAVLNCFLLQALQTDVGINVDIILHRQEFKKRKMAHAWNIVYDNDSRCWYSLDSAKNKILNLSFIGQKIEQHYGRESIYPLLQQYYILPKAEQDLPSTEEYISDDDDLLTLVNSY